MAPGPEEPSYLALLTTSSKLQDHVQHDNKEEPEPFACKPALGVLRRTLPNPKVPSARHLARGFFDGLPQRREHKGVAPGQAQRQEQEPFQRPHGEQRCGRELLMVGLFALGPGDWVSRTELWLMSQRPQARGSSGHCDDAGRRSMRPTPVQEEDLKGDGDISGRK